LTAYPEGASFPWATPGNPRFSAGDVPAALHSRTRKPRKAFQFLSFAFIRGSILPGIPHAILEDVHISVGDEVDVSARDGVIIVQPAKRIRGRCKLEDLLARIPKNYRAEEQDWGDPRGKEVW
jgi:antitoxin MazE